MKRILKYYYFVPWQILDVDNVDLMMGKMLPEGPILVLSFQAQCVNYEQNSKGEVGKSIFFYLITFFK